MNIKQSYLYFAVSAAVATLLRTLLLFFGIDAKSGFIKSEYVIPATVILALIAIGAILSFVFAMTAKATVKRSVPKSALFKIMSILLAIVILYDTFFSKLDYSFSPWLRKLEYITSIIAAVVLISFVVMDFMDIEFPRILSIAPILFWFMRLIIIFTSFSTLANIPDNIFELAALCCILISSLHTAKTVCRETPPKKQPLSFALLLMTAFICFTTALPRLIVSLTGNSALLHVNDLPFMTTMISGIYFLTFAVECFAEAEKN